MPDVLEAVQLVQATVEKIKNDGVQEFPIAANIGDAVRQGDIYIQLIAPLTEPPVFFKKLANPVFPLQLAPGSTKGSRHCLEYSDGIEVYVPETAAITDMANRDEAIEVGRELRDKISAFAEKMQAVAASKEKDGGNLRFAINAEVVDVLNLAGPIFVLKNTTTVSHPEHGNWVLPAGTYRCVFQRTVDTENQVRRVLD